MSYSSGLIRLAGFRALTRPRIHNNALRARPLPKTTVRANTVAARDTHSLKKIETLAERLKATEHPPTIHTYYPALIAELKEATKGTPAELVPPPLDEQQLLDILVALGKSAKPADLQRIEEILSDLSGVFNVEPTIEIHTAILRVLIDHANLRTVHRWLLNMPLRPGHFTPTLEQFHMFLESCLELASFKFMRNLVRSMRQAGCKPTNETFSILLRARWELAAQEDKVPHIIVFTTLLDDMKREGLRYDPVIATLLYDGYVERGLPGYAEELRTLYQSQFPDVETSEQQAQAAWHLKLSQTSQRRGAKAAISLFKSFERDGCTASPAALRAILRHSRNLADLRLLESEFGIPATTAHWSILISNNVRTGYMADALAIYEESKKANIPPDAALIAPLVRGLCRTTLKPPTDASIDQALTIYGELANVTPPSVSERDPNKTYDTHSSGPDIDIYQTLLRGLASSANLEKYFPIAKSLMDDMEIRGISTQDSLIASSIIVLLMRHSPDSAEALDVYKRLNSSLDEKGYAIVLNAFCKLSFGDGLQVPSLTSYFGIVRDMRRAGLSITVEVYTIILHQLGIVATQISEHSEDTTSALRDRLVTTTRRTHDLLTLDAAVSPDAHVWNQLMDTYQRLGCFGDAYRVWDLMYLSNRFDHVSVSIILDACGYAGAWQSARQICAKLFRDGFVFNRHNWNTWLECLCRLGKLNDAVKVACLEMGKSQGDVAPDVESARVLIKFSRKTNQQAEVISRIQRYLPDLWTTLPDDLKRP